MKIIKRNGSEAYVRHRARSPTPSSGRTSEVARSRASDRAPDRTMPRTTSRMACENRRPHRLRRRDPGHGRRRDHGAWTSYAVARKYIIYRYVQNLKRHPRTPPTTRFSALIECNNEEVKQENSNKNPTVNSGSARLHGRRGFQGPHHARASACRCRRAPITRASSTSTTPTTSRSTCTTATWSTWRTCCRTAPSSPARSSRSRTASLPRATSPRRSSPRWLQQPVRRPVHLADASGAVRRGQPQEDPPSGARERDEALA